MANPSKSAEPEAVAILPSPDAQDEAATEQPAETPHPPAEASAPKGFKPFQAADGRWITHPKQGPWNSAKAWRVMVFDDDSQPKLLKLELGVLPPVEIVRGFEVIIPDDAMSVLRDKLHPQLKCDMNVSPPRRYEGAVTDAKYSNMGAATWGEYIAFRDEQKAKKAPEPNRRPIL